jgi:phage terminase large subunit GpA-like protein
MSQRDWLYGEMAALTDRVESTSPSQWAERERYLPPSVTPMPGYYDYDVMPALREIVDCFDIRSSVREVNVMKGAQVGFTVGVLENIVGYTIAVVKSSPVMFLTADAELAKLRLDSYITPMMQQSGLIDMVRSTDEANARKSGKTDKQISWAGGGFLVPFGAINANKLRSLSIHFLLQDETDGFPLTVGRDGDPDALASARTKAYHQVRKILRGSTPLVLGTSKINSRFKQGDQRYWHLPCRGCDKPQVLRWKIDTDDGRCGMIWEMDDDGRLVPGSVRWKCPDCGHEHVNADKTVMFTKGEWIPTAKPASPDIRSYHLSGLYSPPGMFDWEAAVQSWLEAWDESAGKPRDVGKLQEFYNNVLGEPFEVLGDRVRFVQVSAHRRGYMYGVVPNELAIAHTGSIIHLLTCAVDVQGDFLSVAVMGWTRGRNCYIIQYIEIEGDTTQPEVWDELGNFVETMVYVDDGTNYTYRIQFTVVDTGFNTDAAVGFCANYATGVAPIKGVESATRNQRFDEFGELKTKLGTVGYQINVGLYKDRWSSSLRRGWDQQGLQPEGYFNAPLDCTDKQLKELTVETKREKIEKTTGRRVGFEWHRPSGARNELWDLLVYNINGCSHGATTGCVA